MKAFKIVLFISIGLCLAHKSKGDELKYQLYSVLPGDRIEDLAKEYGLVVHEIIAANNPNKFIRVCRGRKEFTDEETGKKFELCQKTIFWLKAGTEINIPVSRKALESEYQRLSEREEGFERESKELERRNAELIAELAKLRAKEHEVAPEAKETNSLAKLVFVILGFCILMSAAIVAIIFYLRKIAQRISQNGKSYKVAELAALQAEVAIEKHNYWERQKELASIMADLRQEKTNLKRDRLALDEEKKRLEEQAREISAKQLDLERLGVGLKNWLEKEKGDLEAREKHLEQRLTEAEESLSLADLGDETTLGADEMQEEGQKGWQERESPQECVEECSSLYGDCKDREPTEPELVAPVVSEKTSLKARGGTEKRRGHGAKKNRGNSDFL